MLGFLAPFIQPVLNFFGGPVIQGVVDSYKAKLEAGNNKDRIVADLAAKELLVEQRELELNQQLKVAQIGHWYEPEHLFGYTMVLYFGKVVLWDKVFAYYTLGSTDPLYGDVSTWAGMIMTFYVGMRGAQALARIIKS